METLGKFKTNLLKDKNSFKIGFNNRSPLNQYKSTMSTSFNIPKLNPTIGRDGSSILVPDNSNELRAQQMIGEAIGDAGKKIGKAIEDNKKRKKPSKDQKEPEQELKKGSFAQKTLDPEGYNNYVRARDEAFEKFKDIDFESISKSFI
jgi:hypothetical protein